MDGRTLIDLVNALLGVVGTTFQFLVSWWCERPGRERYRTVLPLVGLGTLQLVAIAIGVVLVFRQPAGDPAPAPAPVSAGGPDSTGTSQVRDRGVTDDGRAFGKGGSSRFTITVDPANDGIRLTRRLDAGIGEQYALLTVDGARVGAWRPLPATPTNSWRDQTVHLPASITAGRRRLTVVNTYVTSDLDFNEFRYVADQRINGVWRRADTVDIGPDKTASEARHHYRITGQTWQGVRKFHYAK